MKLRDALNLGVLRRKLAKLQSLTKTEARTRVTEEAPTKATTGSAAEVESPRKQFDAWGLFPTAHNCDFVDRGPLKNGVGLHLGTLLGDCLPTDHARQVVSSYYLDEVLRSLPPGARVMDLGCGAGRSADHMRAVQPDLDWVGVDIADSPEVRSRSRSGAAFLSYDGVHLPFGDAEFDLVFSSQVFEHVRFPERLLADVARVLKPGATFTGSVSTAEPYHSYSYWNYTPYGWHVLLRDAGLTPQQYRPGIDAFSLIARQYLGRPERALEWFKQSPGNSDIDRWAAHHRLDARIVNLNKLQFAGHLVFLAKRPSA